MEKEKPPVREQERLTIRPPEELDELIRQEAQRRGTSINQTMIYILNKYFQDSNEIEP